MAGLRNATLLAFALLLGAGCGGRPQTSLGFRLRIASAPYGVLCGDSDNIVVTALGNHRFRINDGAALSLDDLVRKVERVLSYRAVKVVFVRSEPGVFYADFIEMLDGVYHPDELVSIVTDRVERHIGEGGCLMAFEPRILAATAVGESVPLGCTCGHGPRCPMP